MHVLGHLYRFRPFPLHVAGRLNSGVRDIEIRRCFQDVKPEHHRVLWPLEDKLGLHQVTGLYASESVFLVKKAVAFLSENYDKDISLQEIANMISLSPHYFSRLFKAITDLNFVDYLTEIRIAQAKQLLRQTSMMISEVAEKVGYRDASYFSRVFLKTVGSSPREYRGN